MSDTLVDLGIGLIGVLVGGFGLMFRTGKAKAEMEARMSAVAREADEARAEARAAAVRLQPLETHRVLTDERLSRLHSDLAEIKQLLRDLADRITPR